MKLGKNTDRNRGCIHPRRGVRGQGMWQEDIRAGLGFRFNADAEGVLQELEDEIEKGNDEAGGLPLLQPLGVLGLAILGKERK